MDGPARTTTTLPWIGVAKGAPYFVAEHGAPWTPIGQNDAITWPELAGLYRRRDLPGVERHLRWLAEHGVTVLRLMLEYSHREHRYFERRVGVWNADLVRLWDDLFALCERTGLRILLTPFDTFFLWRRFAKHPYAQANGGPCAARTDLLTCPATRDAIKARFAFATERWGGSGALFAWDLYNEMHPAQGGDRPGCFEHYIEDVGPWLRDLETRLHGRAHPQTVSIFGPELEWKPWLVDPILRHPALDFATSHLYAHGTIDDPRDTVAPAIDTVRLVRESLAHVPRGRPFLDSEHGPIHTFKDRHKTLPAAFDDEYFRHMQWAHLAAGGAGGGMRWPNRHPHTLTPGMRVAQRGLAGFVPLLDWTRFARQPIAPEHSDPDVLAWGVGDARQALVWLLRRRPLLPDGRVDPAQGIGGSLRVPGLAPGAGIAVLWDTREGAAIGRVALEVGPDGTAVLPLSAGGADLAIALRHAHL